MGELGKKMPTIFRRLAYVYFEIEALFIREKTACKSVSLLLVNGELFFNITKRSVVSIKTKQNQIHILSDFV